MLNHFSYSAIKKLHEFNVNDKRMAKEFRSEAAMMQLLTNHPNIVKVCFALIFFLELSLV